jgi:hypothetical protein
MDLDRHSAAVAAYEVANKAKRGRSRRRMLKVDIVNGCGCLKEGGSILFVKNRMKYTR